MFRIAADLSASREGSRELLLQVGTVFCAMPEQGAAGRRHTATRAEARAAEECAAVVPLATCNCTLGGIGLCPHRNRQSDVIVLSDDQNMNHSSSTVYDGT